MFSRLPRCSSSVRASTRLLRPTTPVAHVGLRYNATIAEDLTKKATSQTAQAERTLKRFWKSVSLEERPDGHFAILLDKRTLKTPAQTPLLLPPSKRALASLIAHEWDNQETTIKPHALPLTSLAARAIDGFKNPVDREHVVHGLAKFLHTDTVTYHEPSPDSLVKLQQQHWVPLIDWIKENFQVDIKTHTELFGSKQPELTVERLTKIVDCYDNFALAAFERAVYTSKSYLIALALIERHLSVEEAAKCAHVEVQSQIDRWGQVEDTHDVDDQDVRQRLGSAAMLVL